jgi:hypothetical protein
LEVNVEQEEEIFQRRFRERELEQELADARAKLDLTVKELDLARKQGPPLEVQRIEAPVRTEIIYEKVKPKCNNVRILIFCSRIKN